MKSSFIEGHGVDREKKITIEEKREF